MPIPIISYLTGQLDSDDDLQIWRIAVDTFLHDVEFQLQKPSPRQSVYLVIGCCSSWLRPHQTRHTGRGGFAWPSGYGGTGYSRTGLPEFDWFTTFLRSQREDWEPSNPPRLNKHRQVIARLVIPARTARHRKACCTRTPTKVAAKTRPSTFSTLLFSPLIKRLGVGYLSFFTEWLVWGVVVNLTHWSQ